MLIRFSVSNFLSFDDLQSFSMIGGKVRNKPTHLIENKDLKLLKFAAIYGANASGKSNLILAIDFAKTIIVDEIPKGHTIKYFKNREDNKNKKSYFEFEIKLGNHYYAYGFEMYLNKSSICSEWLVELLPDGKEKNIFTRDIENGKYNIGDSFVSNSIRTRLDIYAQDVLTNDSILFLNIMNQNKDDLYNNFPELSILKDIYNWFLYKLDVNYPDKPISNYSYFLIPDANKKIRDIISFFGTGIDDFKIVNASSDNLKMEISEQVLNNIYSDLEKGNYGNKGLVLRNRKGEFYIFQKENENIIIKTLSLHHENTSASFSMSEESNGTRRILDLIEILLKTNEGKIFVIDEIDRSLHPQLTYKFVELYLKIAEDSDRQLIVTTHESNLLDLELLRRDEVWFVDKNKEGASTIYSMEAYNERFDKKIDKAYLEGRYGGIPIFPTVFPCKGDK